MKRARALWISIGFVLLVVATAVTGFLTGTRPILGLDLEGGVSVILTAPDGTPQDVMERALDSIRSRVDAVGVAEPQIFVSGANIEVQIPGLARGTLEERVQRQFCLLGEAGVSFGCFADRAAADAALEELTVEGVVSQSCLLDPEGNEAICFATEEEATAAKDALQVQRDGEGFAVVGDAGQRFGEPFPTRAAAREALDAYAVRTDRRFCLLDAEEKQLGCYQDRGEAESTLAGVRAERVDRQFCVISGAGQDLGCFPTQEQAQARLQETGQERLLQLIGTTARLEQRQVLESVPADSPEGQRVALTCPTEQERQTPGCAPEELARQEVFFASEDGTTIFRLGRVELGGDAIDRATAVFQTATQGATATGWQIDFQLTSDGGAVFADVTRRLQGQQLAIVLDQEVISAPVIQEPITGGQGQITGSFTEQEAKDLATVLNAGALPVELTKSEVRTVSPTLGRESLQQGLVAGLVGLGALMLYLVFYYRLLGVVAWLGMGIWAVVALGVVSLLGRTVGYSLTLAGVAGLVVSLGITTDSYIVFYERLKDEVRRGRTPRSAVVPAFGRAWHTIIAADIVTILAAGVLYLLAVGSVRGFALTLGIATALDMFVVYLFKRPTVFLIARNERLTNLPGFGLTSGVAGEPVPVAGGSG